MKINQNLKRVVILGFLLWILSLLLQACTCPPCPDNRVIVVHDTVKVFVPIHPQLKHITITQ